MKRVLLLSARLCLIVMVEQRRQLVVIPLSPCMGVRQMLDVICALYMRDAHAPNVNIELRRNAYFHYFNFYIVCNSLNLY